MKTTSEVVKRVEVEVLASMMRLNFKRLNKAIPKRSARPHQRRGDLETWWFTYSGKRGKEETVVDTIVNRFKVNAKNIFWRVRLDVWYKRPSPKQPGKFVCCVKRMRWYRIGELSRAAQEVRGYIAKKSVPEKKPYYGPYPRLSYVYRKWNGDDCYSWAVFKRGSDSPVCTGMSQMDAKGLARDLHNKSSQNS